MVAVIVMVVASGTWNPEALMSRLYQRVIRSSRPTIVPPLSLSDSHARRRLGDSLSRPCFWRNELDKPTFKHQAFDGLKTGCEIPVFCIRWDFFANTCDDFLECFAGFCRPPELQPLAGGKKFNCDYCRCVFRLAVMMYIRYPLSLRQVEDLLFERGIDICHGA